jgi:N-acetylglucosaminyldiphosphoundecaprenol N-acetyl-beta-D-mannosaminyltransferase
VAELAASGAGVVFVGLGCPRQERWCHEHRGRLSSVLVGVGAAFDFHAETVPQAPALLQRAGLEWAYRLSVEPQRLWRRYARIVPQFFAGALLEVARARM